MSNSITRRNFLGLVGGATAVASLGLVGCGGTSASGGSGNGGFSKASYVVATDTTFAPFEFTDDSGKFVGIDVDILAACAEKEGFKYDLQSLGFDAAVAALESGQADAVIAGMSITDERKKKYDFSDAYYDSYVCMAVKDGSSVAGYDDLGGKTVAAKTGTQGASCAEDLSSKYGFTITTFDDSNAGLSNLALGRIDAMFSTDTAVYKWEDANNDKVRFLDERTMANNVAYFFPKTDEGQKYCDFVNEQIDKMLADGSMSEIVTKWLHNDMTKSIINE